MEGSKNWSITRITFGPIMILVNVNDFTEEVNSYISLFAYDAITKVGKKPKEL